MNRSFDVTLSRTGHRRCEMKYISPSSGIWPLKLEPIYVLFTDCGFAMNMDTSVYDKYACYGKERLKHATKNQRKDTKTEETKHKTGDKLSFSECNKKNKKIVSMFFSLLNYGFVAHVMVG